MAFRRYILLIACLLCTTVLSAQRAEKGGMALSSLGDTALRVDFVLPPLAVEGAEGGFLRLKADGMVFGTGAVGAPDLPAATLLIPLPTGSTLELSGIETTNSMPVKAVRNGQRLVPVCEGWLKDAPPPVPEADDKVYGRSELYRGGARAEVENLGVMGQRQLFRLTLRPVAYNPARGTLLLDDQLTVTLTITSKSGNSDIQHSTFNIQHSNAFPTYLIVSRPHYRDGLRPFVEWKRQEGYEVTELYVGTHQRDAVKAEIDRVVDSLGWSWPDYMLLVGDAADLQAFIGETHPSELQNHVTDLPYADFTGDRLPDALLGRCPVEDTIQLGTVVRKTLEYEQGLTLDTAALRRVLLVAGHETASVAPTTTNGQVNYLAQEIALAHPDLDTLCHRNPSSATELATIAGEIAGGVALLNYTAHCTVGGWTSPALNIATLDSVGDHWPTVYINNCCKSNDFGGTCFGEQLLRQPHGGAVGVVGATNSTLWNEDYYWAVGPKWPATLEPLFDSLRPGAFDQWIGRLPRTETLGGVMQAGGLALEAMGSRYAPFYWEIYTLFGDPALRPWTGLPRQAFMWAPDSVAVGATSLRISGTPGATVSAVQGNRLLGVMVLDSMRSHLFEFRLPADTLPIIFTATGSGLLPARDTAFPQQPAGQAVTFRHLTLCDTAINLTLASCGTDTIDSLWVVWRSTCHFDSLPCVETAEQLIDIYRLSPGEERPVHVPIVFNDYGPRWEGHLTALSTFVELETPALILSHALPFEQPTVSFSLLHPDGTPASALQGGQSYMLQAVVDGPFDTLRLSLSADTLGQRLADSVTTADTVFISFLTPDTLQRLHFGGTLSLGQTERAFERWMVAGARTDGFEEGFASYPWQRPGLEAWTLDTTVAHSGRYSARSGAIGHSQQTDLIIDLDMPAADSVSFWARTSTEAGNDQLLFSVDGLRQGYALFGNMAWRRFAFLLTAGHHQLRWRYFKDGSTTGGSDCVWIDDVRLPMAVWSVPCGYFTAPDTTVGITHPSIQTLPVTLAPNPTSGRSVLGLRAFEGDAVEVRIADLYGRCLQAFTSRASSVELDLGTLPAGMYFVSATGPRGHAVKKLTISKP